MTLEQLIARAREQVNARITQRNDLAKQLEELRGAETPDEDKVTDLLGRQAGIDAELEQLRTQLEGYEKEQERDAAVARLQAQVAPTGAVARGGDRVHVNEQRTYTQDSDPKGLRFLSDVVGEYRGNPAARERLARHIEEERHERGDVVLEQRAVTAAGSPGTIVPQYLIDLYAPKGRPGRKFADMCRHHDLPDTGMTVYIPRQTAKTTAGEQAAELDTVAEADYDDELIPVTVRTNAGSQTISRQASERGLGTEDIVFEDLLKSYDTALDNRLINAPTWGLLAVANTVTYTDADPTAAELYRKILGSAATVEDVLQDLDEDDLFTLMRGRRWAWLNGEVTDKKPFVQNTNVPVGTFATTDGAPYPAGVRGFLPNGGRVVTDNNLPSNLGTGTNEDIVVVVAQHEAHLWEDPSAPMFIRAEQPQAKKLGIDLVLYGYFAACFNRVVDEQGTPKAVHQKITGTGLVPPVF
ncbi:hypothetical protein [Cellulomonas uda]|uniref:Phage major capsid protein n=1 Tax=Cellulomonas uda TaxID=1714 RepID=A0A4Y3KAS6_CELUD|nr:hypothetical protein [Cellulomonas uda]NII67813.1 hypothetical protein [Cellulomonas uda]GEA79940.1 hypothetical protein CUD01_03840 [Cellulomonas uda]